MIILTTENLIKNYRGAIFLLLLLLLTTSLQAAGRKPVKIDYAKQAKELEQKIDVLERENARMNNELAAEAETSRVLAQKIIDAHEESAALKNELKEKEEKIISLENELSGVRNLMEEEIASHREEIKALQEEIRKLIKK